MRELPRYPYAPSLGETPSFDEQLYTALRQSPWWMISIAIHVAVFAVAGLLTSEPPLPAAAPRHAVQVVNPLEEQEPDEPWKEPENDPRPLEERVMPEPKIQEADLDDMNRVDQDLPYDDGALGNEGLANADFNGPAHNGLIGLGGGAGGMFGDGRGSSRNTDGGGGGGSMRQAVEDALRWLAAHQSPNGGWEAAGFHRWCDLKPADDGPDGLGGALYDPGVTGLATLAFLGAGYTHRGQHPFAKTVGRALRYLRNIQDAEGCFGPRTSQHAIYNHACAALAMVEAYGMTESRVLRPSAQKALDFIALARNPYFAWRYGVRPGDNDTSVTGWMMMALKSAKLINASSAARGNAALLAIDEEAFDGIRSWIEKMTDPDSGRVGYIQRGSPPARPQAMVDRFPSDRSESMTAAGVLARVFIGEDPRRSEAVQKGAELCRRLPPTWNETDGSIDMYYWYYGTLAMYQVGGAAWKDWNAAMKSGIADHQRRDTDYCLYKGSWDPIGPWGADGGRVYSTALMAMCLQVYYRYDRVFVGAGH